MSTYLQTVGNNIRVFRRAKRMTLESLALKIHKSKATVGKYEQGVISIDIETLSEIAAVLGVPCAQLLTNVTQEKSNSPELTKEELIKDKLSGKKYYLYWFDGRTNRIVKSLLICDTVSENDTALFYGIPSFEEPGRCRALYLGHRKMNDYITNYILVNQNNKIENIFLCVMQSLDSPTYSTGLISGISSRTFLPASSKCILSSVPLSENDDLKNNLLLTKADISLTRRYNMFMVDQSGPWD